MFNLNIIV